MLLDEKVPAGKRFFQRALVVLGGFALTAVFFMVLPLIQAISESAGPDSIVRAADTVLPTPEDPPEDEQEEEEEEEEEEPELEETPEVLDLSQLELALSTSGVGGWSTADFALDLDNVIGKGKEGAGLFSVTELDQVPQARFQSMPSHTAQTRRRAPGTVYVIFIVDESGRVVNPRVQKSTDPCFERPALQAIKKWKFEPGKRDGKPVRFRMRQPITFPKA